MLTLKTKTNFLLTMKQTKTMKTKETNQEKFNSQERKIIIAAVLHLLLLIVYAYLIFFVN